MTIAIGLRFSKGVLLCADSEYTQGAIKVQGKKIFTPDIAWGKAVFALAGSVPFAKSAIDLCVAALQKLPRNKRTKESLRCCLESALTEFYQAHIYPHPERGQIAGPYFELLAAIWSKGKDIAFFSSSETVVTEVGPHHTMGYGRDLALFLLASVYHHDLMSASDIANIGIHVLRETKEWVPYCGGKSQFRVLFADGTIAAIGARQVGHSEEISRSVGEAIRRLYICAADLRMTENQMKQELEHILLLVQASRERLQRQQQIWDAASAGLSGEK